MIRSLGRAGHHVVAVGSSRLAPGLASRWAAERVVAPPPTRSPMGFVEEIARIARRPNARLLPVTDASLVAVDRNRRRFPAASLALLPAREALEAVHDREVTLRCARRLGIPFPETEIVANERAIGLASTRVAFPAVLKPRASCWVTTGGRIARATASFAAKPIDAANALRRFAPGAGPALLQSWVDGEGRGVFLLMRHGEPVARFAHRRVVSLRPEGGASAHAESIPAEGPAYDAAVTLLRDIGWEGPAMVEFLVSRATGEALLMEVNGRFWGSLALAIRAGVDFPALFVGGGRGPTSYRLGVRLRDALGEAVHAWRALRGRPTDWTGPWPTPRSLAAALLAPARRTAWQFASADDPLPMVAQLLYRTSRLGRRPR